MVKAYDSVNHMWIIKVLEEYKISNKIINIIKDIISKWKIILVIILHMVNHQKTKHLKRNKLLNNLLTNNLKKVKLWQLQNKQPLRKNLRAYRE